MKTIQTNRTITTGGPIQTDGITTTGGPIQTDGTITTGESIQTGYLLMNCFLRNYFVSNCKLFCWSVCSKMLFFNAGWRLQNGQRTFIEKEQFMLTFCLQ